MPDTTAPATVPPEAVIDRLASQIGQLHAQLAMRSVALDLANARIRYLESAAAEHTHEHQASATAPDAGESS